MVPMTMAERPVPTPDVGADAVSVAEARIASVLTSATVSPWLKGALGTAVYHDTVEVLDDLDVLQQLLAERAAAEVDVMIDSGLS